MSLDCFRVRRVMGEGNAGLAQEFLKECVGGLKAIGVTGVVAQEDVVLEKENVVFAAIEKDEPIFAKLIVGRKIFSKQRAAGFGNDIVFDVDNNLGYLLSHTANDAAAGGLQLRQTRFDDVGLLAALEMLAALANPFLAFENQIGELVANLEGQEFQQAQTEEKVNLYIFVILSLGQRTLQQLREKSAEAGVIR